MAETDRKKLRIEVNGKPAENVDSFYILGEELLCYSMLANLVKNAVEASPEGVPIVIRIDTTCDSQGELGRIRVCNSGAVSEQIRDRFFEKHITAGKTGGTGLGTYSARMIAETQLGRIGLESSPENGTVVTVWLPLSEQTPEGICRLKGGDDFVKRQMPELSLPPLSILLVDDDPFNIQLFETFLNDPRFQTKSADNGKIALERLASSHYDIVLMDMEMPVLNGIETIQRIRSREALESCPRPHLKAVALSAHDSPAIVSKCLAAGFDDYLQKPVRKADALRMLHKLFPVGSETAVSGEKASEPLTCQGPEIPPGDSATSAFTITVDEDLAELVPGFLKKKQGELAQLRSCLEEKNFEKVRQLGHKLKGTFSMYGFEFLSDACATVEAAAARQEDAVIAHQLDVITAFMANMSIQYISNP